MWKRWKQWEAESFRRVWRRAYAGKLECATWRLLLWTVSSAVLWIVLPRAIAWLPAILAWVFGPIFFVCAWFLLVRWVLQRVLWTVRSRIAVICLLLGVAPIVLFTSMAAIATYVFCGQFATIVALESIKDRSSSLQQRSQDALDRVTHEAARGVWSGDAGTESSYEVFAMAWRDGSMMAASAPSAKADPRITAFGGSVPGWLKPGFNGMIGASGRIFLCGASGTAAAGHTWTTLVCSPLGDGELAKLGETLGKVSIRPNLSYQTTDYAKPKQAARPAAKPDDDADDKDDDDTTSDLKPHHGRGSAWVQGGTLSAPANSLDVPVYFSAAAPVRAWTSGEELDTFIGVVSRPTILYRLLFSNSLHTGRMVWIVLIGVAIFFGLLELMAVGLAMLVSGTITRSIADLYSATREIDRGNLEHHIPVRRKDQLSALAGSFNGMTASLKSLLEEQREKERMLSELKIAQEVQRNLFPHTVIDVPRVEVYGICEPARTIGGDYYDFIPFGGSQLYLSLGDISGKGISAALLMASLHSAVRAYRSAEETEPVDFEASLSPGKLLGLLNRHLYTSTQPAKYATLFLASYDALTQRLTYSNGGHLAPALIRKDGSVRRLGVGGSVVGLLDGMVYDDETVALQPGDLLVLYSDGLSEPEREGEEFGEDRVIEMVKRNSILGLEEISAKTFKAVRDWFGEEEQPDDMTMVLMRVG
jgi:sigma-B regulation protein RsbU (phosphoserine phosphatase)